MILGGGVKVGGALGGFEWLCVALNGFGSSTRRCGAVEVLGLLRGGDSFESQLTLVVAIGCCKVLY